jgi:hypothetical protein
VAGIVTIIGASLNLLLPQLIKEFVEFMNDKNITNKDLKNADIIFYKFIVLQICRLFFAEHSKRLFHEIAIRIESTLAKKLINKSLNIAK